MKSFLSSIALAAITAVLIFTTYLLPAQNTDIRYMHNETQDDEYLPMLDKKTSPAYRSRNSNFFTIQVNVDDNGDNILGDAANEPSIAIDPTNPDRIVIGWRQFDNVMSNFRQAGYSYSSDGGQSWTAPEPIDAGIFRSDPVLDFDDNGNFYYNSLTINNGVYSCDVYRMLDDSYEWDNGVYAHGGDKQWMRIDRSGGIGHGNIYAYWSNHTQSSCYPGVYTRSTDEGDSYEECDGIPGNPKWGTLTVGPEGELYIVGATNSTGVVVTKSTTAQYPSSETIWDFSINVGMGGRLAGFKQINPWGLLGQAWIDVDRSNGLGRGNVYVLATVDRDTIDVADVMFTRSTNGGQDWDSPTRINDDPYNNKWQWFGTMSVAPNGRIDAVWLDTRNAPTNTYLSELYYSYSIDQGETWSENERLSEAFDPHVGWPNQNKMGDYFHMISDDNGAHLAWANTINGEQDVYYGYINPWFVGVEDKVENDFSFINYPNPVKNSTTLRYELQKSKDVNISVYNIFGNKIEVVTDEIQQPGIHNIVFDASQLANGIYFCTLTIGSKTETIKLTLVD